MIAVSLCNESEHRQFINTGSLSSQAVYHHRQFIITGSLSSHAVYHHRQFIITGSLSSQAASGYQLELPSSAEPRRPFGSSPSALSCRTKTLAGFNSFAPCFPEVLGPSPAGFHLERRSVRQRRLRTASNRKKQLQTEHLQ